MSTKLLPLKVKTSNSIHSNNPYTIHIHSSLLHLWDLEQDKDTYLCIAKEKVFIHIETHCMKKQEIVLSSELMENYHLPSHDLTLLSTFTKQPQTIYLGPIIAVLTDITIRNDDDSPTFSLQHFCEELHAETANLGGILYVCGLADFKEHYINGYYYHNNTWIQMPLPYPNVIYNRIHSRKNDASSYFQEIKKNLDLKNIPLFNSRFFSKYETHQILQKSSILQSHLPETTLFPVDEMVQRHTSLFFKPVHGSQGRHIIYVNKTDEGFHCIHSSGTDKGVTHFIANTEQLIKWIQKNTKNKSFICQQGIKFQVYQKRTIDFRILSHKNLHHNWTITSIVGRVAPEQSFVANLAQGAELIHVKEALQLMFGKNRSPSILKEMKKIALLAAQTLTDNIEGFLGELGIDLGIDEEGKVWIIEINSKPSKTDYEKSTKQKPSVKALLLHFLAHSFPILWKGEEKT